MRRIAAACASLLFLVSLLLSVIDVCCFADSFYNYEYRKGAQAEKIGMSEEGLMDATVTLLDYLHDKRDDIVVSTEVRGQMREVYNMRETLHMTDVKALYQNAMKARTIFLIVSIIILAYLYFSGRTAFFRTALRGLQDALLLIILFVSFVAVWCIVDFNGFWMQFHYIFFDNDLFLLDPNTSIMINMFPESFFFDIVVLIIIVFVACAALITGLCAYGARKEARA